MAENVYFNMAKETSAYTLWEKLQSVYEKKLSLSKLILIRQLFNMKMKESELVASHIVEISSSSKFSRLVNYVTYIDRIYFEC